MRELKAKDIFPFSKIIKKMEIKEDIKELLNKLYNPEENKIAGDIGLDVVMIIFENLNKAENEFYSFLAPIAELEVEALQELPLKELSKILKQLFSDENFTSFFTLAAE